MSYTPQTEAQRIADGLLAETSKFGTPSVQRGLLNGAIHELRSLDAQNKAMHKIIDQLRAQLAKAVAEPTGLPPAPDPDIHYIYIGLGWKPATAQQYAETHRQKCAMHSTIQLQTYGEQCWKAGCKHGAWGDKPAVNQQLTTEPVDEREAFEREMSGEEIWGHRSFKKKPDGRYANWCVDLMWDVWQARAAVAKGVKG